MREFSKKQVISPKGRLPIRFIFTGSRNLRCRNRHHITSISSGTTIDPSTPEVLDSLLLTRGVYKPDVRDLSSYRLVIILSDDRSNSKGVDFAGTPPFTGYNTYLSSYLDVGGNLMVAGNCVLMGKFYSSPNQLPIIEYKEPYRYVFDGYTVAGQNLGANTELFFNKYFGYIP
jgi:hypothetical protein